MKFSFGRASTTVQSRTQMGCFLRLLSSVNTAAWSTRRRAGLAAALTLLAFAPASADQIDERVKELLLWVGAETGYQTNDLRITVVFAEPKLINIVAYGLDYVGQRDVEALSLGTAVLLPDWFELGRNDDLLVHELTHVLQYTNGARFNCLGEQELEAYETAATFTERTGIGGKPDPWFKLILRCGPNPWEELGTSNAQGSSCAAFPH
jgi:hypothetical protein